MTKADVHQSTPPTPPSDHPTTRAVVMNRAANEMHAYWVCPPPQIYAHAAPVVWVHPPCAWLCVPLTACLVSKVPVNAPMGRRVKPTAATIMHTTSSLAVTTTATRCSCCSVCLQRSCTPRLSNSFWSTCGCWRCRCRCRCCLALLLLLATLLGWPQHVLVLVLAFCSSLGEHLLQVHLPALITHSQLVPGPAGHTGVTHNSSAAY